MRLLRLLQGNRRDHPPVADGIPVQGTVTDRPSRQFAQSLPLLL